MPFLLAHGLCRVMAVGPDMLSLAAAKHGSRIVVHIRVHIKFSI
jgi:hypothetical protein